MTKIEERYEWRYLLLGAVTHALGKPGDYSAACGLSCWQATDWYGTGSQAEYERVAELRKCKTCLKAIGAVTS